MSVDLSEFTKKAPGPGCSVALAIAQLNEDHLVKVQAALSTKTITHAAIYRRLSEWSGMKLSYSSVSRHRNRDCACE